MNTATAETCTQGELDLPKPSASVMVNTCCALYEQEGERVVYVRGVPVFRYATGDTVAEDVFIAQALETRLAKAPELARAFGMSLRSTLRRRERFQAGGVGGLVAKRPGPRGPRLSSQREESIAAWHAEGLSASEMARRLGIDKTTVVAALRRLGLQVGRRAKQTKLPLGIAEGPGVEQGTSSPSQAPENSPVRTHEEVAATDSPAVLAPVSRSDAAADEGRVVEELLPDEGRPDVKAEEASPLLEGASVDRPDVAEHEHARSSGWLNPFDRSLDRMLAYQGKLLDAEPLFASGTGIPRLGVLLAIPALVRSGVFEAATSAYGHIGPSFYGLRTTLVTTLLLALLRIKRPENLKDYNPPDLGRLIGLDRAPEVKTVRRKLARLAQDEAAAERFVRQLCEARVQAHSDALGFLYVDGHVRVYSGKASLPKAHVARMRISLPAAQDVWVNDANGDPLFFITQEAHPQLVSALPEVLAEVRRLVGVDRRVTVVFDRGGWSPKLFAKMVQSGFDILTYRKGKWDRIADDKFVEYTVTKPRRQERYLLHDQEVTLPGGTLSVRQVTRKTGDHQTAIVTTRRDLSPDEVATRMFDRWRQENFFKYMRTEFGIDALVEYGTEEADRERTVPNPERAAIDKELRAAKQELERRRAALGQAALDNPEAQRPTMRDFKIANSLSHCLPIEQAQANVDALKRRRGETPARVPVGAIRDEVVQLRVRRKRVADTLKMLAYQVESDLARALDPHYKRSLQDGRKLLTAAFQSSGDLLVKEGELHVTIAAQSSAHRSTSIAAMCALLNETETCFPGTKLKLRYSVAGQDRAN